MTASPGDKLSPTDLIALAKQAGAICTPVHFSRCIAEFDNQSLQAFADLIRKESEAERDRLREALKEATQSLETIASLAGRKTYGSPPIDTYMSHFDEVRGYAASRAGVGRQALKDAR